MAGHQDPPRTDQRPEHSGLAAREAPNSLPFSGFLFCISRYYRPTNSSLFKFNSPIAKLALASFRGRSISAIFVFLISDDLSSSSSWCLL